MNSNVETLVTLAKYFRGAMQDEAKLPENAVTIPQLVKVNGFEMMKVSDKAKHYHDVVDEIDKSLEAYALQLNALMPQTINSQKKIEFEKVNATPGKSEKITNKPTPAKATEARKTVVKDKKVAVVDAQTNIKEKNKNDNVAVLLEEKKSNDKLPIYGSLLAIPSAIITSEDSDLIVNTWKEKGAEAKAKVYNKVRDLLNNYDMPINELRKDIHLFVKKQKAAIQEENEAQFKKELDEAGIVFDTTTDLDNIMSGKDLTTGKVRWTKKDSDDFDILLLTDSDDEDKVDPQNYVKLWAIYHRVIGDERQAIDILTKFYSDSEKGTIWSPEKARWFLNNLFRVNASKELHYVLENMFIHKHEQGNYKDAIPFAKSFLINYSKHYITSTKMVDGKKVEKKEAKHWPAHKIDSFINRVITGLRISKLLKATEPEFTATYEVTSKGKFTGSISNGKTKVNISNYNNFKDFENACKVIALNQAQMANKEITEKDISITFNKTKGKEDTKVSTKSTSKTESKSKDKVAVQTGSSNNVIDKAKTAVAKTVNVIKNTVNKDVKKGKASGSIKNQSKGVKQAVKASQTPSTKSNVKDKTMPTAKPSNQPQYSAIITLEKDKTYTCVINGFNEVVKTTGAKSVEAAKADFIEALRKYNVKVMEENDKARANFKKEEKGKMLHMKPDFTEGELTFMLGSEKKKTGTNG